MSSPRLRAPRGFTVVELLVVIAVILLLIGLIVPALAGVLSQGRQTESISRLRTIGVWSGQYMTDNKDRMLPSRFDYSGDEFDNAFRGTIRSVVASEGLPFQGTWTDILWTENGLATFPTEGAGGPITDDNGVEASAYLYDSPDQNFYAGMNDLLEWTLDDDVLRSAERNTRDAPGPDALAGPRPYGQGAKAVGDPGYFAANDFFDVTSDTPDIRTKFGFWSIAQIRQPDSSLHIVDSAYGEVIPDEPEAFELIDGEPGPDAEIDFRYGNSVLMLTLDGSVQSAGDWGTLDSLESALGGRRVRVRNLADRPGAD